MTTMGEPKFDKQPSMAEAFGDKNEFAELTDAELEAGVGAIDKAQKQQAAILEGKSRLKGALDELSDDTAEMLMSLSDLSPEETNIDAILEESAVRAGLAVLGAKLEKGTALASLTEMARASLKDNLQKRAQSATGESRQAIDQIINRLGKGSSAQEKAA